MPRGRPPNAPRNEAREAGLKRFDGEPCWCGCVTRYVSNAQCVECSIAAGKGRYAGLDPERLAAMKARDHARYLERVERGTGPGRR